MSKVEKGELDPSLADLVALATALNVDVRWLLTGEASGMTEFVARMSELELNLNEQAVRGLIALATQQAEFLQRSS